MATKTLSIDTTDTHTLVLGSDFTPATLPNRTYSSANVSTTCYFLVPVDYIDISKLNNVQAVSLSSYYSNQRTSGTFGISNNAFVYGSKSSVSKLQYSFYANSSSSYTNREIICTLEENNRIGYAKNQYLFNYEGNNYYAFMLQASVGASLNKYTGTYIVNNMVLKITYEDSTKIFNGSSNITSAYLGSTKLNGIYLGSNKLL